MRLGHLVTGQFQGPCSDIQVEPVSGATAGSCDGDHRFSRLGDPSSGGEPKLPDPLSSQLRRPGVSSLRQGQCTWQGLRAQ